VGDHRVASATRAAHATIKGAEGLAMIHDLFGHLFPISATRA